MTLILPQISTRVTPSPSSLRPRPPMNSRTLFSKSPNFDHVLGRLQKLSFNTPSHFSLSSPTSAPSPDVMSHANASPPPSPPNFTRRTLGAPFSLQPSYNEFDDDLPTIIDTFSPKPQPPAFDLSPTSSTSSDFDSISSRQPNSEFEHSLFDAFVATRSRVVRVSAIIVSA